MAETRKKTEISLKAWRKRVDDGVKLHKSWEDTFKCRELHSKYVGTHQWLESEDEDGDKYSVNLFFSGVEVRKPSLVFSTPRFRVRPCPARLDEKWSPSEYRSKLFQDTINTLASDKRVGLLRAALLGVHESFFRFGVVECGIKSDIVDNPRAGKPILIDDEHEVALVASGGKKVIEPEHIPKSEEPFCRWVPASNVIVSTSNRNELEYNDWIGYFEWVQIEDIKGNTFYSKTARNTITVGKSDGSGDSPRPDYDDTKSEENRRVLLFRIWDLRAKEKLVFAESGDDFLSREPYRTLPLAVLRIHPILKSFYPVPPTYNWLPQQREINEVRETQRVHRRRFRRKYSVVGDPDPGEMDKLESGEDGIYVKLPRHDAIQPLPDAPLDQAMHFQIPATKEDFMLVSGITGEQRGVQEAETATQANIIDINSRIREGFTRELVGEFVSEIAKVLLSVCAEYGSLGFWVHTNVDPQNPTARVETEEIGMMWKMLQASEYDLTDVLQYEVVVDMPSLSPAIEEQERQDWNQLMAMITQPPVMMYLLFSDVLLRKTMACYRIRSEREIQEIKSAMTKALIYNTQMQLAASMGQPPPPPPIDRSVSTPTPTGLPRPPEQDAQGAAPTPGMAGGQPAGPGPIPTNQGILSQIVSQLGLRR